MISVHFQGKQFNTTGIQDYALTSNAKEADVEWFYEDLYPLQCSCLENPRDGEAWWAAVYGVAQSQT